MSEDLASLDTKFLDIDFNNESFSRMDAFEAKIFGPKKKHARAPNKFEKDDYMAFIQSPTYKKLNDEILAIRKRKIEIKSMLFRALPTGEQHEWVEEESGMIVRVRPEWIDEIDGTRPKPFDGWLDNL